MNDKTAYFLWCMIGTLGIIAFVIGISFYIIGEDKNHKCIDNLSNKICSEKGFIVKSLAFRNWDSVTCLTSERTSEELYFTKDEIEACR